MTTRVLVTGATGFVGRSVVPQLRERGVDVITLDRHTSARAPEEVVDWIVRERPGVILHLATHFLASHVPADIPSLVRTNVELGTVLGEGAAACGAVFVNVGTAWQHYEGRDYDPVSLYAATKQALNAMLEYFVRVRGLEVREVTLFDTYGPGDVRPKLIPALMAAARYGTALPMSDGHQLIDLTYVDDVARGLVDLALAETAQASCVLRSGHAVTIRELVDTLSVAVGHDVPVEWDVRPKRDREMREDWVFGEPPSGWVPTVSLSEGLRRTWDDFAASHA